MTITMYKNINTGICVMYLNFHNMTYVHYRYGTLGEVPRFLSEMEYQL